MDDVIVRINYSKSLGMFLKDKNDTSYYESNQIKINQNLYILLHDLQSNDQSIIC